MTGLTRESVATILRDFRRRGIIRTPRMTIMEVRSDRADAAL
jgi:hypothetical protein